MRRFLLLSLFVLCFSSITTAQVGHDFQLFSEDGLLFTLYANGEQINEEPKSTVKIENTSNTQYQIRIVFEDESIPPIEKKNVLVASPGTGPKLPFNAVYKIKEKKGEYKLRCVSRTEKPVQGVLLEQGH